VAGIDIDAGREQAELAAYLGDAFQLDRLQHYRETMAEEFAQVGDEQRFYRESHAYLYDLTAFAMSRTKLPYLRELTRLLPTGARLLDYGCGIGSDGLLLLEAGYRVEFADFTNPSTQYLRWRLGHRGLTAPIHDLDADVPGGFDGAYAFDVIEHVRDPLAFLGEMDARAELVMVNALDEEDYALHRRLPIGAILRHGAERQLEFYDLLWGRSHLVAYRTGAAGGRSRAANRLRISAKRMLRRLRPRAA
jgi:SAM-dependent methyltransferase